MIQDYAEWTGGLPDLQLWRVVATAWTCTSCTLLNGPAAIRCAVCEVEKPPVSVVTLPTAPLCGAEEEMEDAPMNRDLEVCLVEVKVRFALFPLHDQTQPP
jgi:hypothetical protein